MLDRIIIKNNKNNLSTEPDAHIPGYVKKINVTISVTYSKRTTIIVPINHTDLGLRKEAIRQCHLPNSILEDLAVEAENFPSSVFPNYKPEVFKGWVEDDFKVIEEL